MYVVSVNYKKAPLEIRGRFAFSEQEQRAFLRQCREDEELPHSVILSTCNRMELYTQFAGEEKEDEDDPDAERAGRRFERMEQTICRARGIPLELCRKYGNCYYGTGALRHLHRVASGVDSMVMGEDEILGQVKDAWQRAMEAKCTDFTLNTVFKSAVTCAKKIKTDTNLSKTSVSTATLAAGRITGFMRENGMERARVMIIGITGAIGSTVMKNIIRQKGISIVGTSRRHGSDGRVIGIDGVTMIPYDDRYEEMGSCDVIVSATGSPHYTVTKEEWLRAVRSKRQEGEPPAGALIHKQGGASARPVLMLDLSVPADIDSSLSNAGCLLHQMDYFRELAGSNNERKQQAKKSAEHMIEEQLDVLKKELLFHRILPEIPGMKQAAETLGFEKLLYRARDEADYEEMRGFFVALRKALKEDV